MKTRELYESIENPMNDEHFLDYILDAYIGDGDGYGSFYSNLVKTHYRKDKDKKVTNYFLYKYKNPYYTYLFQEWKSGLEYIVTHLSFDKNIRENALLILKYLKGKKPNSFEEVLSILNGNDTDRDDVKDALELLRWDKISEFSGWEYCDSRSVYAKTHKRDTIQHRLYINCDVPCVHLIALEFMKKCKERKVRFFFKFDEYGNRDDTMVFYSNTKNLATYVDILEEIKEEYNLDAHIYEPPVLTGKVNGWIGYGTENILGDQYSFNSFRQMHLKKCIQSSVGSWIRENPNMPIIIGEKKEPYSQFLMKQMIRHVRGQCIKNREYSFQTYYSDKDLKSKEFTQVVFQSLKSHIHEILDYFEGKSSFPRLEIPFKNGMIIINENDMKSIFQSQVQLLTKYYPPIRERIMSRIQDTSEGYGISSNYAIDIYAQKLFEEVIAEEETYENSVQEQEVVKQKRIEWIPMTDEEIIASRKKLRLI